MTFPNLYEYDESEFHTSYWLKTYSQYKLMLSKENMSWLFYERNVHLNET